MILAVGLGNYTDRKNETPHNAGFRVLDYLQSQGLKYTRKLFVTDWEFSDKFQADIAQVRRGGRVIMTLAKPMTLMNNSGISVKRMVKRFALNPSSDLVVFHDDLDLELGRFKAQFAKGPKAHNGIISIESSLGTKDFWRYRIGVETRQDRRESTGADFVLTPYSEDDLVTLDEALADVLSDFLVKFDIFG